MLVSCLFFMVYVFAAFKTTTIDWNASLTNLLYPHGVEINKKYWMTYLITGMGVLGTTVTPWDSFL